LSLPICEFSNQKALANVNKKIKEISDTKEIEIKAYADKDDITRISAELKCSKKSFDAYLVKIIFDLRRILLDLYIEYNII